MYTSDEASKERVNAYLGALEHEKAGYETRLKSKKAGAHNVGLDLSEAQITDRIRQVDDVIKRVTKDAKPVRKN